MRVLRVLTRLVPQEVLAAVRLDELDMRLGAAGEAQVFERQLVDREEAAGGAVLGGHVPERRPVGDGQRSDALAEVLDELADDARSGAAARSPSARGRSRSLPRAAARRGGARPPAARASRRGSPSIAASASIPPTPQPRTPSPFTIVVWESSPTSVSGKATPSRTSTTRASSSRFTWWQMPVPGGTSLKSRSERLPPAQERVALAVPLHLALDVHLERRPRRERIDLHRMVDHELGRDQRVHLRRVAPERGARPGSRPGRRPPARPSGPASGRARGRTRSPGTARRPDPTLRGRARPPRRPTRSTFSSRIRSVYGSRRGSSAAIEWRRTRLPAGAQGLHPDSQAS